jgi:hypothetical protein
MTHQQIIDKGIMKNKRYSTGIDNVSCAADIIKALKAEHGITKKVNYQKSTKICQNSVRSLSEKTIQEHITELNKIQNHMIYLAKFRDSTSIKDIQHFYNRIYNETHKMAEWYSDNIQREINKLRTIISPEKRRNRVINSFDSKMINNGIPGPNYIPASSSYWGKI